VIDHDIPQERDLPPHRFIQLKDELMAHIEEDLHPQPQATPAATPRHPRRRLGLAAAAVAVAVVGIAAATMLRGNQPASANTAERRADGSIVITIREGKNPKDLERRLNDLGVPAVVDFLPAASAATMPARPAGSPISRARRSSVGTKTDDDDLILHPDQLHPGETVVLTFQIDEHGDEPRRRRAHRRLDDPGRTVRPGARRLHRRRRARHRRRLRSPSPDPGPPDGSPSGGPH
jgi:hypothetical protein